MGWRLAAFIGRRLLYLIPIVLVVTALTSALGAMLPGDVAVSMLGTQATPAKVAALQHQLGLDLPLWRQYANWLGGLITGDFGVSYRTGEPVLSAIAQRLPVTAELMALAELGALALGVPLGMLCAARRDTAVDRLVTAGAFGMLSMPPYLLAVVLTYFLAVLWGVLPSSGYVPLADAPLANLRSMALPVLSLALVEWPPLARVLRSDMITTLRQDFVLMARAKGLSPLRILFVHALKPSSLALVTVIGLNLGRLIGGAVIVEVIFGLPGIGQMLVDATLTRDFITLQGGVVFVTLGFVLINITVDMLYAVLDPRVRHGSA